MGDSKYPRLGEWTAPRRSGKGSNRACKLCGERPAGLAHVQVSWFRGEDAVIACCRGCKGKPPAEILSAGRQHG